MICPLTPPALRGWGCPSGAPGEVEVAADFAATAAAAEGGCDGEDAACDFSAFEYCVARRREDNNGGTAAISGS